MKSCPNWQLLQENWNILQTKTYQNGDHMETNFEYGQIQKLMLQTEQKNQMKKVRHLSSFWVMVLELSNKCISCSFELTSARDIILLKQFIYMHLKGPIRKWYCLIYYDLLFWSYWSLNSNNFLKFMLSQHFVIL